TGELLSDPERDYYIECFESGDSEELLLVKSRVVSVDYFGKEEAKCITIDREDGLYITDDNIVTHNSFVSMVSVAHKKQLSVFFLKPAYIEKWMVDFKKTYILEDDDIYIAQGSDGIK